jgi:hypothetical protein
MTMREEFEAWSGNHETNGLIYSVEWAAWQAAYRAGQEAMRERAAKFCPPALADHIRALPVDA